MCMCGDKRNERKWGSSKKEREKEQKRERKREKKKVKERKEQGPQRNEAHIHKN